MSALTFRAARASLGSGLVGVERRRGSLSPLDREAIVSALGMNRKDPAEMGIKVAELPLQEFKGGGSVPIGKQGGISSVAHDYVHLGGHGLGAGLYAPAIGERQFADQGEHTGRATRRCRWNGC